MNNKLRQTFIFTALVIFLTSCQARPLAFESFKPTNETPFIQAAIAEDFYYRPNAYGSSYSDLFQSHPNSNQKTINLSSRGQQNVLVIPVDFSDYPADKLGISPQHSRQIIENTFFGHRKITQWESLTSYYYTSSYGQLLINGKVSDWYRSDELVSYMRQSSSKTTITERILKGAINWYKTNHDDINDFDQNSDGYLDAVFLIYAAPHINNDSVLWAFTSFDKGQNGNSHINNPIANAYAWASYHFMNVYHQKGDAHTYIHEFGHLLGLSDYYNTSTIPSTFIEIDQNATLFEKYQYVHGPTGKVDMMDYSIGDHTALSKMLLDWTKPYVITSGGTLTLRPFINSGDLVLLANQWNNKAFDEYLLIEFYSPSGLNYMDSERAYGHASARLMSNYGLKVYHVDARASYHRVNGDTFLGYQNDTSVLQLPEDAQLESQHYLKIAHTNTFKTTINNNLLYRLLEKGEQNTFLIGQMATNDTLFGLGDSFGINDFKNFTFNNGDLLPFSFQVDKINKFEVTITFFDL